MVRTIVPTRRVVMVGMIGVVPGVAPRMIVIVPTVVVVVMRPVVMPAKGIAGHIVPVVPVGPRGNDIGV